MATVNHDLRELKAAEGDIANDTATSTIRETKDMGTGDLATLDAGYTESDVVADLPPAEGKRLLRKIDSRLVSHLAVLYLVAFIDRSNM